MIRGSQAKGRAAWPGFLVVFAAMGEKPEAANPPASDSYNYGLGKSQNPRQWLWEGAKIGTGDFFPAPPWRIWAWLQDGLSGSWPNSTMMVSGLMARGIIPARLLAKTAI